MEGNGTITVGELLRCRSPLSAHHDSSPYKRKRSPGGDGLPQNERNGSPEGDGLYQNDAGRVPPARNQPPCVVGWELPPSGNLPNLLPLSEEPSLLVGRIQLWNSSLHSSACSSTSDCLAFSDDSATVCCAVRDFDLQLLGRLVRLLSWSYIPEREGGGALEIRQLELAENSGSFSINSVYLSPETASVPNLVLETPPFKQKAWKPRLVLAGCVSFISPPFAIPYGESRTNLALSAGVASKASDNKVQNVAALEAYNEKLQNSTASKALNEHLLGFFLGLSACNHKPSCLPPTVDHCHTVGIAGHGNQKPSLQDVAHIFFSGSPAAWRPILLAFSGRCISITGLRRKVLMAGKEQTRYSVYAATSTSIVSWLCTSSLTNVLKRPETGNVDCIMPMKAMCMVEDQIQQKRQQTYRGKNFGSYIGVVTEMFVRGRLLELDGRVWLLLTHQPLSQVHGLRVGATVAAFHVHFLNLTSFSESTLLLAACSISHLVVTHFSPLKTLYAGKRELQSCLSRFIESLPFLSAFWALQIIASFKQKFRGFYNEKEILGSTKNKGIAENYLRNLLDLGAVCRRDIFKEFFSHNICWLAESVAGNFSLQVPPIKNFCKQIQILWLNQNSCIWSRQHRTDEKEDNIHDLGARRNTFIRRVVSSNTLGVTLLGFLQFSKVVGKLQLLDATGAIDVVIPDLQTAQCFQLACQVTTYKLVIEGYLEPSSDISLDTRSFPLSWQC